MHTSDRRGFTLLEVVVAALLLTVGIGAVLGSTVLTTRMVVRGRQASSALQEASARLERIRAEAAHAGSCAAITDGADSMGHGVTSTWRIRTGADGHVAAVETAAPVSGATLVDSLVTVLPCP